MGLREDRMYLKEYKETQAALKENAEKQRSAEIVESYNKREDIKIAHEAMIDNFYKYKDDVKKTLLKEALGNIYKKSITKINENESRICDSLIENYINEVGVSKILRNMKFSESGLLIDIQEKTDEYAKEITKDATAFDANSQTINKSDINDFWNSIDKSNNIDDITSMIRLRVSDAEEEFINRNQQDKQNIKAILDDTAKRVQSAKISNDDELEEAVEESESRLAKNMIYKIQHESRHNVFDRMVRNLSEVAIKNVDAKDMYTLENGRLDMESIVESARCMYTLLEMVGSLGIEKVDAQYIEDTLKSIK